MTLSFLQKIGLSFFGGGLEFFENGQKISLLIALNVNPIFEKEDLKAKKIGTRKYQRNPI